MWVVHRALASSNFGSLAYVALGAMAVLTVIQLICVWSLHGEKGQIQVPRRDG